MDYTSKLSEVTVIEFISLMVAFVIVLLAVWLIYNLLEIIISALFLIFGKYKFLCRNGHLLYIYALKDMAKHRKQVRNAPTEKAFYLYYNRMIGAYESYVALGIFEDDVCSKLLDVRGVYVWKQESEDNK